jgi:hypothetical protein
MKIAGMNEVRPMAKKIRLTIEGEGVSPETVDLADVVEFLHDIRTAIHSTALSRGAHKSAIRLSLAKVNSGSLELLLTASDQAEAGYNALVLSVETGDSSLLPQQAVKSVLSMSKKATTRNWTIGLNGAGGRSAKIGPDSLPFTASFMEGRTSLLIHLIRVGGEGARTATVRLPSGDKLTADVSGEGLAKQLGERLYQDFEVVGDATWNSRTLKVVRFKIVDIGPYMESTSDPAAAITELSSSSGDIWHDVNPDEYVRDLRAD